MKIMERGSEMDCIQKVIRKTVLTRPNVAVSEVLDKETGKKAMLIDSGQAAFRRKERRNID